MQVLLRIVAGWKSIDDSIRTPVATGKHIQTVLTKPRDKLWQTRLTWDIRGLSVGSRGAGNSRAGTRVGCKYISTTQWTSFAPTIPKRRGSGEYYPPRLRRVHPIPLHF